MKIFEASNTVVQGQQPQNQQPAPDNYSDKTGERPIELLHQSQRLPHSNVTSSNATAVGAVSVQITIDQSEVDGYPEENLSITTVDEGKQQERRMTNEELGVSGDQAKKVDQQDRRLTGETIQNGNMDKERPSKNDSKVIANRIASLRIFS